MPELQDIFNHVHLNSMSPAQAKAFNMIRHCRTATLGSHAEVINFLVFIVSTYVGKDSNKERNNY
ncbi:hypothetical protein JCM15765_24740 [Paradesulfitobacterium aromaticivorans]